MITFVLAIITLILLYRLNQILGIEVGFKVDKETVDPFASSSSSSIEEITEKTKLLKTVMQSGIKFNEEDFITKSKEAFKIIFEAYAKEDKQTLKDLLSPKLYKAFSLAIDERHRNGEVLEGTIIQFVEAELIKGKLSRGNLYITVKFVTDQTIVLRSKDGSILEGNPNYVETSNDVWVFSKKVNSADPRWFVHEITPQEER